MNISPSSICSHLYCVITKQCTSADEFETVWELAAKNAHWRSYDENFRFLIPKTLFPWDQIHWELWLQAHHRPTRSPFPPGFCRRFQRGEQYSSCNFNHQGFTFSQPMPLSKATGKFRQNCVVTEIHSSHPKQLSPFLLHCLVHTM